MAFQNIARFRIQFLKICIYCKYLSTNVKIYCFIGAGSNLNAREIDEEKTFISDNFDVHSILSCNKNTVYDTIQGLMKNKIETY